LPFALWLCCALLAAPVACADVAHAVSNGIIDTYVGGGNGDGDAAINAAIDPRGVALVGPASAPDLYIADGKNNRVRRVDGDSGVIETIAGDGVYGYDGDGGDPQNASMRFPLDVAVDGAGNVYIADTFNNRIRRVGTDRRMATVAGNGVYTYSGEGIATQESLSNPYGVTVGPDGNLYIADLGNNRIRKVSPPSCAPSNCVISTVVGNGNDGFNGDGGQALNATLNPSDVAFDSAGNMFIADWGNDRIRRVAPNGIITTVAGGGLYGPGGSIGDGGLGTAAVLQNPSQIAVDTNNNVYIAETVAHRIRMLRPQGGNFVISTVAGTGATGWSGDGGQATAANLFNAWGIAATSPGTFWLSQSAEVPVSLNNRVRKVASGVIRTVVGGGIGDGGAAINALVDTRGGEAVDGGGVLPDLYFADGTYNVVRRVDGRTGIIDTIAGTGAAGYSGDGGPAVNATLRTPFDAAVGAAGVVYIADTLNNVVRRVANGTITTAAGTGQAGYSGEGAAAQKNLSAPRGVDVDRFGNLYIADSENNRIRKVSGSQISTVAGNGSWSYGGDNGPATSAALRTPSDVVVADDGTLYIADAGNDRIRRVSPGGVITTFAGDGVQGFAGDNGPAAFAQLNDPAYLSLDAAGNLFIADAQNNRVRRVVAGGSLIETVAGNGQTPFSGDGGAATGAGLGAPSGVAVDPSGSPLFVSARLTARVRMVEFGGSPPPATVNLSGLITYYANSSVGVAGVGVALSGPQALTALTDSNGTYSANLPTGVWTIEPAKAGGLGPGVSALDAVRVLQVIAGDGSFTPLQHLACDVTGDGSLSVLDAVRILQLSAGEISQFPVAQACRSDWIFYPRPDPAQNQSVAVPSVSAGNCRPGRIVLNPLLVPVAHQDFDGILFGDCTGNWTRSAGGTLRLLAPSGVAVQAGVMRRGRGGRLRLPVYVRGVESFHALDIRIGYDRGALTLRSARPHGAAIDSLTRVGTDQPNVIAVSVASPAPIDAAMGAVLVLEFAAAAADSDAPSPRVLSAQVDEQTARVVNRSDHRAGVEDEVSRLRSGAP
jgi:hypothetical protein